MTFEDWNLAVEYLKNSEVNNLPVTEDKLKHQLFSSLKPIYSQLYGRKITTRDLQLITIRMLNHGGNQLFIEFNNSNSVIATYCEEATSLNILEAEVYEGYYLIDSKQNEGIYSKLIPYILEVLNQFSLTIDDLENPTYLFKYEEGSLLLKIKASNLQRPLIGRIIKGEKEPYLEECFPGKKKEIYIRES